MKKLFASLALAGLTVAAFAQTPATPTLTFSGSMDFGGLATSKGLGGAASAWQLQSFDPVNSTQGRLNLNAKYDAGTYGWYIRAREQDGWTSGNSGTFTLRRAYAWVDLANGMVRVSAGRLNTQSWATGSFGGNYEDIGGLDGAVGSTVEIKPIDGLNVGVYVPYNYGVNKTSDNFGNLMRYSQWSGAYKVAGLGDIEAGVTIGATHTDLVGANNGYAYIGAAYTGDKNLIANITLLNAYNNDSVYGFNFVSERVEYNFMDVLGAPVHASLISGQQLYNNSDWGHDLFFMPQVDYTADIYNLGVQATILSRSGSQMPSVTTSTSGLEKYGYEVDPFVKVAVAKGVSLKGYVGFTSGKNTLSAGDFYMGGTAPGWRDTRTGKTTSGGQGLVAAQSGTATTIDTASLNNTPTGNAWGYLADSVTKVGVSLSVNY
jgi:hypothetical protein